MKSPFDCPLEPLTWFQSFQLYVNYALGLPFAIAIAIGRGSEYRNFVLLWAYGNRVVNTLAKVNKKASDDLIAREEFDELLEQHQRDIDEVEAAIEVDRGGINGPLMPSPSVVQLASGVSEKGRKLYAMYEERFGKIDPKLSQERQEACQHEVDQLLSLLPERNREQGTQEVDRRDERKEG